MSTIKITSRWDDRVKFECAIPEELANSSLRTQRGYAIKQALLSDSDLRDSDLSGSNLSDSDLSDSNLSDSNLSDSDLRDSDLSGSNLSDSDLRDSNLSGSNLRGSNLSGSNLSDSDLRGSNLSGSNLSDSDLRGSNLSDSNLSGSNLSGSNLSDSDLRGSNLRGSDLRDSDLSGSNLSDSDLRDSNLSGSNLSDSNLSDSDLSGSNLRGARNIPADVTAPPPLDPSERQRRNQERAARYRARNPDVPVVEALDAKILGVIEAGSGKLDMSRWHTCETTHCRAGWAVTLAGEAGKALEAKRGPAMAGGMIYRASTGRLPHFYGSDADALEDIRSCAAEQVAAQ